jgi:hypothetical protein
MKVSEKYGTRVLRVLRFWHCVLRDTVRSLFFCAAPKAGPRREHRGQIIWGPEQANNLAPLQIDILKKIYIYTRFSHTVCN